MMTYHKQIKLKGHSVPFRYKHFSEEIQKFLKEKQVVQEVYAVTANSYYLFIHLSNGDRIDVQK